MIVVNRRKKMQRNEMRSGESEVESPEVNEGEETA